jgi:hypothetical protein
MQLVLYSLFWSKKYDIPLTDVKCAFVTLNHEELDSSGQKIDPVDMFMPEMNDQKRAKTLVVLDNFVERIKKDRPFYGFKPKKSQDPRFMGPCRFCEFNGTKHCP